MKDFGKVVFVMIFLFIATIGCARTLYTHPTKNQQDFERDRYKCRLIAEQSAANWGSPGNVFMIVEETKRCLEFQYEWQPEK